jgi:hypothetical protein
MEAKGWLSLFCGILAVASMIFAGIGFGNVSDMEQAEADNMLRMTFIIPNVTKHHDGSMGTQVRVELDTGVLSQSHVRYRIYEELEGTTKASVSDACYTGYIDGASDQAGWYELGSRVSLAVSATDSSISENTYRSIFAPGTKTENITFPGHLKATSLPSDFNTRLGFFNTLNSVSTHNLLSYNEVYEGTSPPDVPLFIGTTTTTATETSGDGDTTTTTAASTTSGVSIGCKDEMSVQPDKFFYAMVAWHNLERTPRRDSDALVFTRAAIASAHSLSVVSQNVSTECFLSQYRDDVQALMMSFVAIEGWAVGHLVTTIFVLLGVFALTRAKSLPVADKWVYTIVSVLLCGYLAAIAWMLRSQIGAVVDGVKDAIPTSDCGSTHIQAVFSNDGATHAETMYLVSFILNILVGVFAFFAIVLTETGKASWERFAA